LTNAEAAKELRRNMPTLSDNHPAVRLWSEHHPEHGYPDGVVPVPERIPGLAFFPGGLGLWGAKPDAELPPMPIGGVMVLGHDFHSRAGYDESYRLGGERLTLPTWRNLLAVLDEAAIPRESCFFTNLYMGLRSGDKTTGVFPGASNDRFRRHCQDFLLRQLSVQRPRLIITLGIQVPPVVAELSDQLAPWATGRGIRHIDTVGALRTGVAFERLPDFSTTVVALLHPSLRQASLRHRRYRGLVGPDTERALLRDALVESREAAV
jgi:hypothetical protein